jgi:hypothetical protein
MRLNVVTGILSYLSFAIAVSASSGCSSSSADDEAFATFQLCFDDHAGAEGLSAQKSLVICCLDHPIASAAANTVCGDNATSCATYVNANLKAGDAPAADVTAGCADYITQRAK